MRYDDIPEPESPDIRQIVREEVQASQSASLPPPQTLAEYDQLVPGTAERIVSMTERSAAAKIDIADRLATAGIKAARTGLKIVIGLTVVAFAAAMVFFALGNQTAGVAFAAFSVILFIQPFLSPGADGLLSSGSGRSASASTGPSGSRPSQPDLSSEPRCSRYSGSACRRWRGL
jgi:uncharacterized membrane protein